MLQLRLEKRVTRHVAAISGIANCLTEKSRNTTLNGMALTRVYEVLKRRFDDCDAGSPLEFKYITQLRFVMSTIGSWPYKQFGRSRLDAVLSMFNLLLVGMGIALIISDAAYLQHYRENVTFFDLGHILLCSIFEVLFLIHAQIHIISGLFTIYVMCQMVVGVTLFTFMPWYNNYSRGMFRADRPANATFEQAVYFYCFTDVPYTTETGYWLLFAFNVPIAYMTTIGLCVFDLLVCLIVFQIWGHLKILKHNLLSMPLPVSSADGMYSAEENIRIRQLLKENILHHNFIITFVDKCSHAFSEYLFVFYVLMQAITCILLLEVSSLTADALAKYGPLTIGMHQQLIQVSILFEMLNSKSEQLIEAVYATPWERMDAGNRRTVMILLQRVQSPVALKAAKVVPVGVTTMSAVLKTTFSYYMMLKTVAGER